MATKQKNLSCKFSNMLNVTGIYGFLASAYLTGTVSAVDFKSGGFSLNIPKSPVGNRSQNENNIIIRVLPHAFMDNRFVLSQNQPAMLKLGFNNSANVKIGAVTAHIELPNTVEVLGVYGNLKISDQTSQGDKIRYAIDVNPISKGLMKQSKSNHLAFNVNFCLILRTSLKPGTEKTVKYWVSNDNYSSPVRTLSLGVIPAIKGQRPKRFKTGAWIRFGNDYYSDEEKGLKGKAINDYARFYSETGCNVVQIGEYDKLLSQFLLKYKVARYFQGNGWTTNGYMIGKYPRSENVAYKLKDGSFNMAGICPVVIYKQEQPYFNENLKKPLRRILIKERHADQIVGNWEPFMFQGKGCFCDRCRKEFMSYTKLNHKKIAEIWPDKVTEKYFDIWTKFRSWQHAKVITTLEQTINEVGKEIGLDSHFTPAIAANTITHLWDKAELDRPCNEYAPIDYINKIPSLISWGPYAWQDVRYGYDYVRGMNFALYCTAKDSIDFCKKRNQLIGYVHGHQSWMWVTEPESMVMDIFSYFINGYAGQIIYVLKGYDARYWNALAEANTAVAEFEDFIFDGKSTKMHKLTTTTPYPVNPASNFMCGRGGIVEKELDPKKWMKESLLQSWEFNLGERRLVVIANYWQNGECFVKLSFSGKGLENNRQYCLSEPLMNRFFGVGSGKTLSRDNLMNGIEVHIGAQRFAFFLLEPIKHNEKDYAVVNPSDVEAVRLARLSKIMDAYSNENNVDIADIGIEPVYTIKPNQWSAINKKIKVNKKDKQVIKGAIVGNDPYISADLSSELIDADKIKQIVIPMSTSCGSFGQIFWKTEGDQKYKYKNFNITSDSKIHKYIIKTKSLPGWIGKIKFFRIDPIGNTVDTPCSHSFSIGNVNFY